MNLNQIAKKKYIHNKTEIKDINLKFIPFLKEQEEILEAYIFGSIVKGNTNKSSDIDMAIYIDKDSINNTKYPYGYKSFIISKLLSLFSTNKVDLVILNDASPLLYHRVVSTGIRVYSIDVLNTQRREYRAIQKYLDLKPLFTKMHKELYKRIDTGEYGKL